MIIVNALFNVVTGVSGGPPHPADTARTLTALAIVAGVVVAAVICESVRLRRRGGPAVLIDPRSRQPGEDTPQERNHHALHAVEVVPARRR